MTALPLVRSATRVFAAAAALSAAAYAAYVAHSWLAYGNPPAPEADEMDDLLDQFMPEYDVVERHSLAIAAPLRSCWRPPSSRTSWNCRLCRRSSGRAKWRSALPPATRCSRADCSLLSNPSDGASWRNVPGAK